MAYPISRLVPMSQFNIRRYQQCSSACSSIRGRLCSSKSSARLALRPRVAIFLNINHFWTEKAVTGT